jgi:hypothetical protein
MANGWMEASCKGCSQQGHAFFLGMVERLLKSTAGLSAIMAEKYRLKSARKSG